MKRATIWGAWYGSRNVGDQALLLSIIDLLSERWPNLTIYAISDNPRHVSNYTSKSKAVIKSIHSKNPLSNIWALFHSDVLILGGGVPIFETNKQLLTLLIFSSLSHLFRTKIMAWCVSSQRISSKKGKWVLKHVFQNVDLLTCRDLATQTLLNGLLAPKTSTKPKCITQVPDPVLSFKVTLGNRANKILKKAGWDGNRPLAALTPRVLRAKDGEAETHYNPKTRADYQLEIDVYSTAAKWLWSNGYQPIIVPMNTVSPDDDRVAGELIKKMSGPAVSILMIDEPLPPKVVPAIFERCALSLVSRVHASICCMVGNCPCLMYSFAPKHHGVMQAMDLEEFILDETDAMELVISKLENMVQGNTTIRKYLEKQIGKLSLESRIPAKLLSDIFL